MLIVKNSNESYNLQFGVLLIFNISNIIITKFTAQQDHQLHILYKIVFIRYFY